MTGFWVECDASDPDSKFIWEEFVDEIYDWNGDLMAMTLLEINFTSFGESILLIHDAFSIIHRFNQDQ